MRRLALAAVIILGIALWSEVAVRISRVTDVPIFNVDAHIGYIPTPGQSGKWLWRNGFAYNEVSMGVSRPFRPSAAPDIVLVGDSLVYGGVNYREEDRLGPMLQRRVAGTVWPISAPSWGLQNELQYMLDHPDVMRGADRIVLITNSADYAKPSSWSSEITHPRSLPWSRLWMLWQKRFGAGEAAQPHLLVPPKDLSAMMRQFRYRWHGPVLVVAYPTKAELSNAAVCGFTIPAYLSGEGMRTACVKRDQRWTASMYRDDIHPDPLGNAVLSDIIRAELAKPTR